MKKVWIFMVLLASSQVFVNCGNDDDGPAPPPEEFTRLLGVWEVDQVLVQGESPVFDPECGDQLRLEFKDDGSFTRTSFSGEDSDACQTVGTLNGEWKSTGGNTYQLELVGSEPIAVTYTFVDNDSKFTFNESATKQLVFEKK